MPAPTVPAAPSAAPAAQLTHHVKVRGPGERRFAFLTPRGGTNRLRVHAAQFTAAAAAQCVETLRADNTTWTIKAVPIDRPARGQ